MANIDDSGLVSVIERLVLVFGVQFSLPRARDGALSIEDFRLLVAKRGAGYSWAILKLTAPIGMNKC